ncbi:hypothetical protein D3C78_656750 [compost metagenome]
MADIRHLQALAGGDGVAKCLAHLRKQCSGLCAPHDAGGHAERGKARRRPIRPLALAQLLGQACGLRQLGLLPLEGLRGKVARAAPRAIDQGGHRLLQLPSFNLTKHGAEHGAGIGHKVGKVLLIQRPRAARLHQIEASDALRCLQGGCQCYICPIRPADQMDRPARQLCQQRQQVAGMGLKTERSLFARLAKVAQGGSIDGVVL